MIVEFDDYKVKLTGLKPVLATLEAALKLDLPQCNLQHYLNTLKHLNYQLLQLLVVIMI